MGHAFSSHHPSFITNDYQYQTGKLAQSEVQKYRSFEEDGDQKLFIEERCIETVDECKEMKSRYDECVERIEGQEGKHCGYQYMNMWGCIDDCAAKPHFQLLKHGI